MYIDVDVCMLHLYTYIHLHLFTYIHLHLFTYIHLHLYTYIHLHLYTYIHYITLHYITLRYITLHYVTLHYIHTYIHTYIHRNHHFYCLNPFCLMLKPQPQHLDNGLGIDKWSTEHRDDCCILQRQRSGLDVASVAPWWADFEHKYGDFTKNFMVI